MSRLSRFKSQYGGAMRASIVSVLLRLKKLGFLRDDIPLRDWNLIRMAGDDGTAEIYGER